LLSEVESSTLERVEEDSGRPRILESEALSIEPVYLDSLPAVARSWAEHRLSRSAPRDRRFRGSTDPPAARAWSLSALERYQDCPFKFFSADVLRLEEDPEDESSMSPRARGRFIHEVFQRFFEAWDARRAGAITPANLDEALALCREVAEAMLARLPEAEAALERTRLFGSAISTGAADIVLGLEASRPVEVQQRWLEYRLEGTFSLGTTDGRSAALRGVADRIDLLSGRRLRIVDYKSGVAPNTSRALQVPIYALCAKERLEQRDGSSWTVDEASYVSFSGRRSHVPVLRAGEDAREALDGARSRVLQVLEGISHGAFPPRPHDPTICRYCAFSTVCRKDYADDE
jgi:ATP-dependent helicase/nuclease subunit B